MSIRTVQRWLKMWSESGDYRPKQNDQKGHSAKLTDLEGFRQFVVVISNKFATFIFTCKPCPGRGYGDDQCLKALHFLVKRLVEANPGLMQKEMGALLGVSHTTVGQAFKKINFTRKKHTLMKNKTKKSDNNLSR